MYIQSSRRVLWVVALCYWQRRFQRNLAGEILDQVCAVTRLEKWNNEDLK